jgi:hypothetical protein
VHIGVSVADVHELDAEVLQEREPFALLPPVKEPPSGGEARSGCSSPLVDLVSRRPGAGPLTGARASAGAGG